MCFKQSVIRYNHSTNIKTIHEMVLLSSALYWIEPYIRVGLDEMVLLASALYWIEPYIRVG